MPADARTISCWLIANHKSGGTMTYSDMSHIARHFAALNAQNGR